MARQHSTAPIPPFPPEINRDYFGAWLSGFFDGEGHLGLSVCVDNRTHVRSPAPCFSIGLRADDLSILGLIQSFLGCGKIRLVKRRRLEAPTANPQMLFCVTRATDLANRIIPHLHACPLLAKKHRDFEIWEKGVLLFCRVAGRKRKAFTQGGGFRHKWAAAELAEFLALRDSLKDQRVFNSAVELPAPRPAAPEPPGLFDSLP